MEQVAGVRIERGPWGVRLTPPPERLWVSVASMAAMLAVVAWLTAISEHGVATFMVADFALWCWAAATAEWTPIRRVRTALEIGRRGEAGLRAVPREVHIDGRPVRGRIRGAAIALVPVRRAPPAHVVFLVAEGAIVRLARIEDRNEAVGLARLVHAELGLVGEPPVYPEAPIHTAVGCVVLILAAIVFAAAYLATAVTIDLSPELRARVAVAAALLHGVLAIAMRRVMELACAGATRKAARGIFGVEP
jgi:hypothetical protein